MASAVNEGVLLYQSDEQFTRIKSVLVFYQSRQASNAVAAVSAPAPVSAPVMKKQEMKSSPAAADDEDDDDDFLTGSLSDDDEADGEAGDPAAAIIAKKNAEREAAKRALKGVSNAKSSVILDIKPEDSDTDLEHLLAEIKLIQKEGLTWGGHEFIPVAFGIKKIRLICVVVDELVSVDDLQESIQDIEGVQSTDIQAFNKL